MGPSPHLDARRQAPPVERYFINLDHSTERLREFRARNAHVPQIERFRAIDGTTVDRNEIAQAGVIAADLGYAEGAVGCALSHIELWRSAASRNVEMTVCEDDAILHTAFLEHTQQLLAGLAADWDFVLWGWNFDSVLFFDLLPGVSPCVAAFDQDLLRRGLDRYQHQPISPRLYRLFQGFGTICYTVSPAGARKLLERCLPLRPMSIAVVRVTSSLPNYGIDVVLNSVYPQLRAYVSVPPCAVTCNDHSTSTVQQPQ